MEAILLALIQQLNSSVFTLIAILLGMGWLLHKSGGWAETYKDFKDNKESVGKKIDDVMGNVFPKLPPSGGTKCFSKVQPCGNKLQV